MSATNLKRVVNDELDAGESTDYLGYHIIAQGNGKYAVQLDGYAGSVGTIDSSEYDSALELVDEIDGIDILREEYMYFDNGDMVDWAGKIMTGREEKAEEDPEKYLYVPPADELPDQSTA